MQAAANLSRRSPSTLRKRAPVSRSSPFRQNRAANGGPGEARSDGYLCQLHETDCDRKNKSLLDSLGFKRVSGIRSAPYSRILRDITFDGKHCRLTAPISPC